MFTPNDRVRVATRGCFPRVLLIVPCSVPGDYEHDYEDENE
jgi:hypothetical protein